MLSPKGGCGVKRWARRVLGALGALAVLAGALWVWTARSARLAHTPPDYPAVDLTGAAERAAAGMPDYPLLFAQTGLGPAAVDALAAAGRTGELKDFQRRFFEECSWRTEPGAAVVRLELREQPMEFAPLEKGDILLTASSRCGGWRNGHAAIVLDAEAGVVLEAYSLGLPSRTGSLDAWRDKPAVAVVRLANVSAQRRAAIAGWAASQLDGLPYSLLAGLAVAGESAAPGATQCAHLVWCAYAAFGYDLDPGGWPVTPRDLARSPLLETVQVWGLPQGMRWPS